MGKKCRCKYCMQTSSREKAMDSNAVNQEITSELGCKDDMDPASFDPRTCTKLKIVTALHAKARAATSRDVASTVSSKPSLDDWFKAISPLPIERLMEIAPHKWAEEGAKMAHGGADSDGFDGAAVQWPPLVGLFDDDAWHDIAEDADVTEMVRLIAPEVLDDDAWCLIGPDSPPAEPERPRSFQAALCSRASARPAACAAEAAEEDGSAPGTEGVRAVGAILAAGENSAGTEATAPAESPLARSAASDYGMDALGAVDEAPYTGEPRWWGRDFGAEKKSRGHRDKVARARGRRALQREAAAVC